MGLYEKVAFCCVTCRRSWKARTWGRNYADTAKCPECGADSPNMGPSFKAPRKRNDEQWEKLEVLIHSGIRHNNIDTLRDAEKAVAKVRSDMDPALDLVRMSRWSSRHAQGY